MLRPSNGRAVCMHSLASLLPFYAALSKSVLAEHLGLAEEHAPEVALIQCPDPCRGPRGGTVLMEVCVERLPVKAFS